MVRGVSGAMLLLVAGALGACGGSAGGFDFETAGMGTGQASATGGDGGPATTTGGSGTGGSGNAGTGGSSGTSAVADSGGSGSSGGSGTGEDLQIVPCTGIDLLFVIDNSETMLEEQIRLKSTAAAWITMINSAATTAVNNINVGVITTDDSSMATADGMGTACNFASGQPFMQYGQPAGMFDPTVFSTELECALDAGIAGSPNERPIDMMLDALSPTMLDGGDNAGFLRHDSLLVVVVLTDEEDDLEPETQWGSAGDPPDWITNLAAIKGDIKKDVIVLSFIGVDKPNACPDFQWDGMTGAELSPRLKQFTEAFPAGAVYDICSDDYYTFLSSVVAGISGSCANFSPA